MKISGTEWCTAVKESFDPVKESKQILVQSTYGYRVSVNDRSKEEINEFQNLLKSDGITTKLKTSEHVHSEIPAGTPFLEVMDEKSIIALERMFLKQGIKLETDRYKEYGLEYINRTPAQPTIIQKKSFLSRLFGR